MGVKHEIRQKNRYPPPRPDGIILQGNTVQIEPLNIPKHATDLFDAHAVDSTGNNWTYLPYGPFTDIHQYTDWLKTIQPKQDPYFFAIIRKSDTKAVGIASYYGLKPQLHFFYFFA